MVRWHSHGHSEDNQGTRGHEWNHLKNHQEDNSTGGELGALSKSETPPRSRGSWSWASDQTVSFGLLHSIAALSPQTHGDTVPFLPHLRLKPLSILQMPHGYSLTPGYLLDAFCMPRSVLARTHTGPQSLRRSSRSPETHM